MNQEFKNILDQAIQMVAKGQPIESVVNTFPQYSQELLEILPMVQSLNTIAKAEVPAPIKKYAFQQAIPTTFSITEFFTAYKFAFTPLLLLVIVLGGIGINRASNNSLPGQVLYSLKSAKEQTQLTLTFDQNKLATLHVELAQKRLDEVKRAIESNNPEQEREALTKLAEQTEKTLDAVSQVAIDPEAEQQNQVLLNSLVAINKEQKSIMQAAAGASESPQQVEQALTESKETDINLAKLIATVNEQTLIDLPNKISVTGIISSITNEKIILEKSTFVINEQTVIEGAAGEITTASNEIKGKVTVIGTREDTILYAKKIVIIDPDAVIEVIPVISNPQVKGTITPLPATTNTQPKPKPAPVVVPPATENIPPVQEEAQAGFIAEPASSQYLQ